MADVEIQKLLAVFEASLSQYEKELKRAQGMTNRLMDYIEQRGDGMQRSLGNIGRRPFFVPLLGQLAALLSPMFLVQAAIQKIGEAAEMGKFADRIGLGVEKLQELRFGFTLAGVDAKNFDRAIEEFNNRIGQAANGNTRLAQILRANGVALRDSNGEIRSSEELLRVYADLIANARTQQEKFVLATEAFGAGAGKKLVSALSDGSRGLDEMGRKARDAGAVVREDLVRDAEQLKTEYDRIIMQIDAAWQRLFVNVTTGSKKFLQSVIGEKTGGILPPARLETQRKTVERQVEPPALSEFFQVSQHLQKLYNDLAKFQANRAGKPTELMAQVEAELNRQIDETIAKVEKLGTAYTGILDRLDHLKKLTAKDAAVSPDPPENEAVQTQQKGVWKPTVVPTFSKDQLTRAMDQARDNLKLMQAETAAMLKLNPLIEDYGFQVTKARTEQQLFNAAKEAGINLDAAMDASGKTYRQGIMELATVTARATAEQARLARSNDELRQQWEEMRSLTKDVMSGFVNDMKEGVSATEALRKALGRVADKLLDMSLNTLTKQWFGTGTGANIFSFLFPGRASGGPVLGGQPYMVGEKGPELFVPGRNGTIVPNNGLTRSRDASGVTIVNNNDFRDSSSQAIAVLMQRIDRLEANLPRIVQQVQTQGRSNNPFYGSP